MNQNVEENKRALRRRVVIVYMFAAMFVFALCLGAYFGYFAAQVAAR